MKIKRLILLLCAAALTVGLCSCTLLTGGIRQSGIASATDKAVRAVLDAIEEKDPEKGYAAMYPGTCDYGEYEQAFNTMCSRFPIEGDYELERRTTSVSTLFGSNAGKTCRAEYLLTVGKESYIVTAQYRTDKSGGGLETFYLTVSATSSEMTL